MIGNTKFTVDSLLSISHAKFCEFKCSASHHNNHFGQQSSHMGALTFDSLLALTISALEIMDLAMLIALTLEILLHLGYR